MMCCAQTTTCKIYVQDMAGRKDGVGMTSCTNFARRLKQTYRYMRGAKCMCSHCHGANEMSEELQDKHNGYVSTAKDRKVIVKYEMWVNRFETTVVDPDGILTPSDALVAKGRAPVAGWFSGPRKERKVLLSLNHVLGQRQGGLMFVPRPQALQLVRRLQEEYEVWLWECDGVTTGQLEKLGVNVGVGVVPAGECIDKSPRRSLDDMTMPQMYKVRHPG